MTRQCSWCGNLEGQSYWKVAGGALGGRDGGATGVCRLKDFHALVVTDGGNECEKDLAFCSKAEAKEWADSLGPRFVRWLPSSRP